MPFTKITDNCHANSGVAMMDEARQRLVEQNRSCILVMEGGAEAIKCKQAKPDAVVVHRFHGVYGDANWEHMHKWGGPEKYIDKSLEVCNDFDANGVNRIVMQFMNESGVLHADDKPGEMPLNIQCALKGLEYANLRNAPIAINLDGTGGPDDSEVQHIVPLIQRMNEINRERGFDFAYLMHHEYYLMHNPRYHGLRDGREVIFDPLHFFGGDPANMLNYANWVNGRYARVMSICQTQYGMEDYPPIIIGEFGADDTFSQYHGPWPPDYPGYWLTEEQYAEHLIWLEENVYDPRDPSNPYYEYAKKIKGLCVFSCGNSGGWEGFNTQNKGVYQSYIRNYAMGREPLQEENTMGMQYECVRRVRVRTDHVVDDSTVTDNFIEIGQTVDILATYVDYTYRWGKHTLGWSAIDTLDGQYQWLKLVTEPDPEPEPEPEPDDDEYVTVADFEVHIEEMSAKLDAITVRVNELQDQIDALEAPDWRKIAETARLSKIAMQQAADAWAIIESELSPEEQAALGEESTPL